MNFNIMQRWSLKTKMTLFTLAIFLISIWSLAFYASRILRENMERLLGEQQFSTVSLLAAQVSLELDERLSALETIAAEVSPAMLADPAVLQAFLEHRPIFLSLFNGGTYATGIDGTAIADVPLSGRIGVNYMDIDHIASALKEGKSKVGRPVVGKMLRAPVLPIAAPIRNIQGKVIGALSGVTTLSKPNFLDKITENRYGKTGGYMLNIPQYRLIVTASDKSRIMEMLPAPGISSLIDRFIQGYEGTGVTVNSVGVEVLASAKAIPVAGWYVAVALPTAEAFAPIRAMQQRILLAAILMTLLVGSLIWWMLRRLLSPMMVAARILDTQSDTNQPMKPLPISNSDEIGRLIGGFNRLLKTLAQREEALKEREKKYWTILQTAMDGFWLVDHQGRLLEVNEAYCRMSGYSMQELLTMQVSDLEAVETAAEVAPRIQRNMTLDEEHERFETLHRRKDGRVFDVEISAQFLPEGGGEGMVFLRDITEQKKSEKEFRLVFEQSRDAVIWADLDAGIIIKVNVKAEELTERTREELIGKNQTCLSPPEQDGEGLFRRGTTTPEGGVIEGVVFTRSGKRIPVRVSTTLVDLGSRRVVQGIFHDITELKRVENALKESEERNRYIIDTSLEGIWIGDEMYQTTYVNKRFAQMLGYEQEEMLGRNAGDFVTPEQLSDHLGQVKMRRSGQEQIYERCLRKRDGERLWAIVSARGIYNTQGQFAGSFGMFTDITAHKEAEDALRISLAEKEVLLKEVHHRVKNNLAAIMGLVDLQEQALDNQVARTALAELSARIRSMVLVHEQLYQSENLSQIDFQNYLEILITHLRSSYERFGGIHVSVAAEGVEMDLDNAVPCGLIITELTTNAYKYAFPAGRPRPGTGSCEIAVSAAWDGATYTLTVADNGVGLPEDLDWTNTKTLGLLLVKMLGRHQLQGTMELDRTEGTMFRLQFTPKNR